MPQLSARRIRRDVTRQGVKKKKRASLVTGCEKNTFHIPRATFFKRLVHTVAFILLRRRYLTVIRRCDRVAFSNVQSPIERHRADTKFHPKCHYKRGGTSVRSVTYILFERHSATNLRLARLVMEHSSVYALCI